MVAFLSGSILLAQDYAHQTFKDRWVINTHSTEMLAKRRLDVRITHRFGDLAGAAGGWRTFYGLENAADILIGAEYGATDNLSVGLFRTKGAGALPQLLHATLKGRFVRQGKQGAPLSVAALGLLTLSTTAKSDNPESLNYFPQFSHRMVYHLQVLGARKFSDAFSLQLSFGWTHRNLVPFAEENELFHAGLAGRLQLNKVFGIVFDVAAPLNGKQSPFSDLDGSEDYSPSAGIGLEIDTGGHVFQINLTNARGIMPTDYIPYNTNADWGEGQFRLGFTISRMFNL